MNHRGLNTCTLNSIQLYNKISVSRLLWFSMLLCNQILTSCLLWNYISITNGKIHRFKQDRDKLFKKVYYLSFYSVIPFEMLIYSCNYPRRTLQVSFNKKSGKRVIHLLSAESGPRSSHQLFQLETWSKNYTKTEVRIVDWVLRRIARLYIGFTQNTASFSFIHYS